MHLPKGFWSCRWAHGVQAEMIITQLTEVEVHTVWHLFCNFSQSYKTMYSIIMFVVFSAIYGFKKKWNKSMLDGTLWLLNNIISVEILAWSVQFCIFINSNRHLRNVSVLNNISRYQRPTVLKQTTKLFVLKRTLLLLKNSTLRYTMFLKLCVPSCKNALLKIITHLSCF